MSRIVAVTPHARDAVLSCGGTLARHAQQGHEVVLVVLFADGGGGADAARDDRSAAVLGLHGVVRLELGTAAARGYADGLGAFDGLRADDDAPKVAGAALAVALAQLAPDLVLTPLGLTGHVDQLVLSAALDELAVPRLRWVDLPHALTRTPGAPLGAGELVVIPIAEQLAAKLEACAAYAGASPEAIARHAADEGARVGAEGPVELLLAPVAAVDGD